MVVIQKNKEYPPECGFKTGDKVRRVGPHLYLGKAPTSELLEAPEGEVGTVMKSISDRNFSRPHVAILFDNEKYRGSNVNGARWVDTACLEKVELKKVEIADEIAALFGLKTPTQGLSEAIGETQVGSMLSEKAIEEIVAAVLNSPFWKE